MKLIGIGTAGALLLASGLAVLPAVADEHHERENHHWADHRAKHWDSEHRDWEQRGGYVGVRIPEATFSVNYGPQHAFRVETLPYRDVDGMPAFQYNGYWMTVVDPYPESWPDGWWANDDVYVSYDNGYYLYNARYPHNRLALRIVK